MAITQQSNLVHFNRNRGLVDSDQVFGSFKNHVDDLRSFDGLIDSYVDNSGDYFTADLWGQYKTWGTMIYIKDARPLVEIAADDIGDYDAADYITITNEDETIDDRYFTIPDGGTAEPSFYVYKGNDGSADTSWDTDAVNQYTITADDELVLTNWVDLHDIVGGTEGAITDISISLAQDPSSNASSSALNTFAIGNVTESEASGVSTIAVTLPTRLDIANAFKDGEIEFGTDLLTSGNPRITASVASTAALDVASLETSGNITSGANLSAPDLVILGNDVTDGLVRIGKTTVTATDDDGDENTPDIVTNTTTTNLFVHSEVHFGPAALPDGEAADVSVLVLDNDNPVTDDSVSTSKLRKRTLDSHAFSALDVVDSITGTTNQIVVNTTGANNSNNPKLELANTLLLSQTAGSVTIGDTSGHAAGLSVAGDATINGDLTVHGNFVSTTSSEVTFEDNLLSLNIAYGTDNVADDATIASLNGTTSGLEVFHGQFTFDHDSDGGTSTPAIVYSNTGPHSRPYIQYEYNLASEPLVDQRDNLEGSVRWGRWAIVNRYEEGTATTDNDDPNDIYDDLANNSASWTEVKGYILSTADVTLAPNTAAGLHDTATSDIKNLATPYLLVQPQTVTNTTPDAANPIDFSSSAIGADISTSNQTNTRKFGRVSFQEVTYGAHEATPNTDLHIYHGLNTHEVLCFGIVVTRSGSSNMPSEVTAGTQVIPKHTKTIDPDVARVKVLGASNGDVIKFVFIG